MARRSLLRPRILTGIVVIAVLAAGVLAYQITHRGAPSFRRGGEFATGVAPTTTSTAAPETTVPSVSTPAPAPTTSSTDPVTTATTRRPIPSTTATTRAPAQVSTTTRPAAPKAPPTTTPTTAAGAAVAAGPRLPALGTYTYAVDGTEEASFVGSRRYPARMTTVVHGAPGLASDQLVFDLRYSDQHEEREIVNFKDDGIYFDFEGGSVTFGPRTETSEADYDPPMIQIPKPLAAGVTRSATVVAKTSSGSVSRTEDVKVTVVGQETISVAGAPVQTWKVQVNRQFRPGSADQGARSRTYWFDPARNLWVQFAETFHGERNTAGFRFIYSSNLTATLVEFKPS